MSSDYFMDQCIVCGSRKQWGRNIMLFKFPHDIDRCRAWVKALGIRDLILMPIEELRQQVVCANHFDPECINKRLKRLHKVAIPLQTPYPPLSDVELNGFPKYKNSMQAYSAEVMPKLDRNHATIRRIQKPIPKILNDEDPVINYDRPLLNSLEVLLLNERHAVKQMPKSRLNTIAVPLMAYSSSLEKGTVFAAEDPGSNFLLPFVPFIEAVNHNVYEKHNRYDTIKSSVNSGHTDIEDSLYYENPADITMTPNVRTNDHPNKVIKKYVNVKALAKPRLPIAYDVPLIENTRPLEQVSTNDAIFKKPLGTVRPNIKTVVHQTSLAQRKGNVSFGLKTVITGSARKPSNVMALGTDSRYKGIKQYANNKLTIQKNISLFPSTPTSRPNDTATNRANGRRLTNLHEANKSKVLVHTNMDVQLIPNTKPREGKDQEVTTNLLNKKALDRLVKIISNTSHVQSPGPTNTDLLFVPYTQYEATVTPESINAHTGEGTLEYGLPLMNCIGTVFQGNIGSTTNTGESNGSDELETIEIPLMQCFKTLQQSSPP